MNRVYLDYAATTPADPRVIEVMCRFLGPEGCFGNAASNSHSFGWQARQAVENAREQVAALLGASPREIIWTSGATEAINLAVKGAASAQRRKGRHIVTCRTEHKAVLDSCHQLQRDGFEVTYLRPQSNGIIDPEKLSAALRKDTILVSVMHVNNETGVIQDIARIADLCAEKNILCHVDAAQSAGKLPIDLSAMAVNLMSFCAHKLYGPKGIGALYVRRRPPVSLQPLMHGGGHERGLRAGTLASHQIAAMGEACAIAAGEMAQQSERIGRLAARLWQRLTVLGDVVLNGDAEKRLPGILNLSFAGVDAEAVLLDLDGDDGGIALSSGSACTSASQEPSHVLQAMGYDDARIRGSLRISFGRFTTEKEIDYAGRKISDSVSRLRQLSPLVD